MQRNILHHVLPKNLWYKKQLPPMNPQIIFFFSLSMNTRTRSWHLKMCGFVWKEVMICRISTPNIVLHKSHSHSGELTSQKNRYSIHRCYLRLKWLNFRRGNWSKKNIVLSLYSNKTSNTTTGWIFSIEYGLHAMCNVQFATWKLIW